MVLADALREPVLLELVPYGPLQLRESEDDVVRVELVEKVLSAPWRLWRPAADDPMQQRRLLSKRRTDR